MKRLFWRTQAALFYGLTLVGASVPDALAPRFSVFAGFLLSRIVPNRRSIVLDNMSQALSFMKSHPLWRPPTTDLKELARQNFENLGMSLLEICQLYHGKGDAIIEKIELRGREHFDAARAKGKGVICFSGHCGNWELMALAFGHLFGGGAVVARRQNNPFFNTMVERMRMHYNSRVIYREGALRGIIKSLKAGDHVGILADQAVLPQEGALVEMLGRTAWASRAPVILANTSGAPLVPVFIHREGGRHVITFYPEHKFSGDKSEEGIRLEAQALSRYVENFVVKNPTQWYWVHRRWKRAGQQVSAPMPS